MTMLWKRESAQRLLQFLFNLSSACCCCDVGRAAATLYSQVEQAYRGRCSCAGAEFRNHFGFKYVVPCDGRAGFDLVSWLLRETGWGGITFTDAPSLQRAHAAFAPVGGWSYWCAARAGGCTWSYFRKSAPNACNGNPIALVAERPSRCGRGVAFLASCCVPPHCLGGSRCPRQHLERPPSGSSKSSRAAAQTHRIITGSM